MNSARPALLLHLLSACALMAYTVVACTVTPGLEEDPEPPAESIVDDAREDAPPVLGMDGMMK